MRRISHEISQLHVTENGVPNQVWTGWDYVYHAKYAPKFNDQVIETMENTGIKNPAHASRLNDKVRRFIEYEVKQKLDDVNHKISEYTASSVVFEGEGPTVNFYQAEVDFLQIVIELFGKWQAKGEELA